MKDSIAGKKWTDNDPPQKKTLIHEREDVAAEAAPTREGENG